MVELTLIRPVHCLEAICSGCYVIRRMDEGGMCSGDFQLKM